MELYAIINLAFEFATLLLSFVGVLCVFLFPHFAGKEKPDLALLLSLMASAALFGGLFTIYGAKGAVSAQAAFRCLVIIIGCCFTPAFNRYLYRLSDCKETGYKVWLGVSFAAAGLLIASLIGNLFGGYYYAFDAEGRYVRGAIYCLIPAVEGAFWVVNVVLVYLNRKRLCRQDVVTFCCYCSMMIAASILQCVFCETSFIGAISALAVVVLLFGEQSKTAERVSRDKIGAEEARLEAAQAKERLLRSQVSPHFIYNALTAIQALPDNPDATKKAIGDFAKYLRQSLSTINENTLIPFEKELENVQIYFRLEKIRFGKSLQVEYDVGVKDFDLPAMSVQILAENAVKHGVSVRRDGGTVRIKTAREGGDVVISVEDDGVGFDVTKQMDSSHIGIDNVRNRVRTLMGGTLSIDSEPGKGTIATIRFPLA